LTNVLSDVSFNRYPHAVYSAISVAWGNVISYFAKYDEQIDDELEVRIRNILCDRNIELIRTLRGNWKFNYTYMYRQLQFIVSIQLYLCKSKQSRDTESINFMKLIHINSYKLSEKDKYWYCIKTEIDVSMHYNH